jgi:amino acid adenylation domain-containing protein/non-ribosomal peptide synthase protein (TIGR01720 family)
MPDIDLIDIVELIEKANSLGVKISFDNDDLVVQVQKENKVDPLFFSTLRANKSSLKEYFSKYRQNQQEKEIINAIRSYKNKNGNDRIQLSFAQERLWFLDKLQGSRHYHIPLMLKLFGSVNRSDLEASFKDMINRHEILRTVIREEDGKAYQVVTDPGDWQLPYTDDKSLYNNAGALQSYIDKLKDVPFNLSCDSMLRAWLIKVSKKEHILVIVVHHIAADGWSVKILKNELVELYRSRIEQRPASLKVLPVQYADYALWQRQYLQGEVLSSRLSYWTKKLAGVQPLELPTDFVRSAEQSVEGEMVYKVISCEVLDKLHGVCRRQGVTLFMALLSAFKVLLYRYTGQQDICIGTPIAGRQHQDIEGLIGFFVNTLALRSEVDGNIRFQELLQQVKQTTMEAYEHQEVPFEKIVEALELHRDISRTPIFQVLFSLQNMEENGNVELGGASLTEAASLKIPAKFDISLELLEATDGLHMVLIYCSDLYTQQTAIRMLNLYERLLQSIPDDVNVQVKSLKLLSEPEEQELLQAYNDTAVTWPMDGSVVDLFEQQVAATPEAIAVLYEEHQLTYRQLNERANQLAHYLRNHGVKEEVLVPICLDRSLEMIVGILGILKAGGAWVPVDPAYPSERIDFILEDTKACFVITTSNHRHKMPAGTACHFIELDSEWESVSRESGSRLETALTQNHIAYVLYTSGSTGKPKGVLTEHKALVNRLLWGQQYIPLTASDAILQKTTFCFDVSVFELLWPLIAGARLVFAKPEGQKDNEYLKWMIESRGITILHFVPPMLEALLLELQPGECSGLKNVLCGGESLKIPLVQLFKQKLPLAALHHLYGPTEAAIDVTYWPVPGSIKETDLIPIGKPVANTSLYILDAADNLVPPGSIGELHIGGMQVARGYLNQPELTAEKFVPDPFSKEPGARMYRTGDMAKWLVDGNIAFMGRRDDQVKIRGNRVEPAEVESVLQQAPGVSRAVVLVLTDHQQHKRLAGFVITQNGFEKEAVLQYMSARLPDFMIPWQIYQVAEIPLTSNGKVDRKQLSAIVDLSETDKMVHVAPRNILEEQLALIWKDLLGINTVGIHDNFFELGGDSIIAIQLVSRVRRLGYQLHPRDVFTQQTIARLCILLAQRYKDEMSTGEQGVLNGQCGLLPVQQLFFNRASSALSHYNQSVLLGIPKNISPSDLERCIKHLVTQHDSLRFIYQQNDNEWKQVYADGEGRLDVEDLRACSPALIKYRIGECADNWQQGFDITRGDLMRAVLVQTPDFETHNRLLIIIHHLAVDGVSWRILLADLELLLSAAHNNTTLSLGKKTSSYRQWYEALIKYGQHRRLISQIKYWENSAAQPFSLPVDSVHDGRLTLKDMQSLPVKLGSDYTHLLLQKVPAAYHTEVNDLLLAALGKTLQHWSGSNKVIIGLEGHGREDDIIGIDTTRTVGWFTSMYPVLLDLNETAETGDLIKHVKEQLRSIPDKGIGYGVLKYLNRLPLFQGKDPWQIVFNYLGQIDNVVGKNNGLKAAGEQMGTQISREMGWNNLIELNCIVMGGELVVRWSYSSKHYSASTIEKLAKEYIARLEQLITHCTQPGQLAECTPSDFGLTKEINYRQLDHFLNEPFGNRPRREAIESMYRLSSLQQGLLFYGLYDNHAGAYINQTIADLPALNVPLFVEAWNYVLQQHSILRTAFYYDVFSIPVQCVYRDIKMPVTVLDYSGVDVQQQLLQFKDFTGSDLARGFNFQIPPLMRLTLIRLKEEHYRMIWTHHHLILDGWSCQILIKEILQAYETLLLGKNLPEMEQDRYEDYIRHIELRDREQEETWWRKYLDGITEVTLLPFISAASERGERTKKVSAYNEALLEIDAATTRRIRLWAGQHHITVNTIMQGVWAFLLHRYTGNADIAYGVTVSGRPESLSRIEQRIGMYINTIPLHSTLREEQGIVEWLQEMQRQQLLSREYQHTSLSDIQGWMGIKGDLFDSILGYQNFPAGEVVSDHNRVKVPRLHHQEQTTNYPLSIRISERDSISIEFIYKAEILAAEHVRKISNHFELVLLQMTGNSSACLRDIHLLSAAEENQLIKEFNDYFIAYPDQTIIDLFSRQVSKFPDAVALVYQEEQVTYQELDERSSQLAHYLIKAGVKEETLVPICIQRSMDMIISVLGVLKAGGAYIPIDPAYPADRINYILEDSSANVMITSTACKSKCIPTHRCRKIELDSERDFIALEPVVKPEITLHSSHLAYVIYTSGSTGNPKGVMIEHRGIVNILYTHTIPLKLQPGIRIFQFASFSFDVSCYEIFGALLSGGLLVLSPQSILLDAAALCQMLDEHKIDLIVLPPVYLPIIPGRFHLKSLISGGEALTREAAIAIQQKGIRLLNAYGPTENTIWTTMSESPLHATGVVTIGKPLPNVQVYVLDEQLRPVPVGIAGELCIGGTQVARGYLNRPALTAEKFIPDFFSKIPGAKLYKTGDLARWLPDGNIEFIGRKDNQVKIRGYRVELGEIECVLQQAPKVIQAVVLVDEDKLQNKKLIAFVVTEDDYNKEIVLGYIKQKLPEYMVPAMLKKIDSLPFTANGKVNRKQLQEMITVTNQNSQYVPPGDEIEENLVQVWQEVLGIEQVGIQDDFVELGGNSMVMLLMQSHLKKRKYDLPLYELFAYHTIREQAAVIRAKLLQPASTVEKGIPRKKRPGKKQAEESHVLLLNKGLRDEIVFVIPGIGGKCDPYRALGVALEDTYTIYGLQMMGTIKGEKPLESIQEIATKNIEWIRKVQPSGPYRFIAHSFGMFVTYEMVRQLEKEGHTTGFIATLDVEAEYKNTASEAINKVDWLMELAASYYKKLKIVKEPYPDWIKDLVVDMSTLPIKEMISYLEEYLKSKMLKKKRSIELASRLLRVRVHNSLLEYTPAEKIKTPMFLFKAQRTHWKNSDATWGWSKYTENMQVFTVPGNHLTMVAEKNAKILAKYLKAINI